MIKRPSSLTPKPSVQIGAREKSAKYESYVLHKNADSRGTTSDAQSIFSSLATGPANTSQDLDLDWSKFENHTFFDSAASKVNAAFLHIVNDFPFDGTKKDLYTFMSNLVGFEKYVYDQTPKSVGYYNFSGSSYVKIKDSTGAEFPDFSSERTGKSVLDPSGGAFSVQMHLNASAAANEHQVIAQYTKDDTHNLTLFLSQSASTTSASLCFVACSGSLSASAHVMINKGKFQHIAAVYKPSGITSSLEIYCDGELKTTSSNAIWLGRSLGASTFSIASGSSFNFLGGVISPPELLNAAIDDLRVYHASRSVEDLRYDAAYPGFADDSLSPAGLRLYYKFNEPPGSHVQASVALDSSGNCLHGKITGYDNAQRVTGSSALTKENDKYSPVLFPDFPPSKEINQILLTSGTLYDQENPNYIVRLIPQHYFLEGQQSLNFADVQGEINNAIQGISIPGSGKMSPVQIMTAMLLIYAKVFDEIKIFHDHFSKLTYVEYDANNSVSDRFLPFLADYYGVQLPNLFGESDLDQYLLGERMQTSGAASLPLKTVQNAIFRRILTNIREIITAKGTHAGIHALFNAAGIAPNAFFRIREYGGPVEIPLASIRDDVIEIASALDLSGSLAGTSGSIDTLGFKTTSPHVIGSFLSGSRFEVGFPEPSGSFALYPGEYHGISATPSDGLLTSGSWTFESSYRYDTTRARGNESLARMHVTGTASPSNRHGVIFNIVATAGTYPTVNAYVAVDKTGSTQPISLHLTGVNVFDGNRWHVSLTRMRSDDPLQVMSAVSSSYTLRCARITAGGSTTFFSASGFFDEGSDSNNVLQNTSEHNTSGSFVVFGSQSLSAGSVFLNNTANSTETRETQFSGRVFSTRFWSKALTDDEFREHARSYRSLGVDLPIVNFGFNSTSTGSFQKLRMDLSCDQSVTSSNAAGSIVLTDMSQQARDAVGFSFEPSKMVIKPESHRFTQISTRFDVRQTTEKVRVRSFSEAQNLLDFPESLPAPIYEQTRSEISTSDNRLSIEASAVDALNDDIVKLLSSLEFFEKALGDPRVLNEDDYPDLEKLRRIYFNRLVAKPELRAMYDVFRWVSDALGDLILQLVPMNSTFLGISYIIESHVAERARVKYYFDDVYKQKTTTQQSSSQVQDPQGGTSQTPNQQTITYSSRG